ncbi:hypothetical protein MHYP_G00293770 [Metynnis hypsauchen]
MTPCPTRAVLYCSNCQEPLSTECLLTDTHRQHSYITLQDAVKQQLDNIKRCSTMLEPKVRQVDNVEPQITAAKQQLEDVYDKIKKAIVGHYEELWNLLAKNREQASNILEAEKETLNKNLTQLEKDEDNYKQTLDEMTKEIKELKEKRKTENPGNLLEKSQALDRSLTTMEDFYSSVKEVKFDCERMRALEKCVKKIVQKNRELLPRPWEFSETITFNNNRKHKDLKVSEKASEVSLKGSSISLSKRETASWSNIIAVQNFNKGQHYWEMELRGSQSWVVGVVEKGWEKNSLYRPLGRDSKSWVLESDEGDLTAWHGNDLSAIRDCTPQRLGVYLDCDRQQVKFYDVATGCILHSFCGLSKQPLYPAFSLRAKAKSTAQLQICRLMEEYDQFQEHNVQSSQYSNSGEGLVESYSPLSNSG